MAGAPTHSIRTRALHLAGAVGMFAAGVYLIDSTWLDLGLVRESGQFAIVGYTLAYAATVIALAAGFGSLRTGVSAIDVFLTGVVGFMALLGLGVLFGAIAIEGAFVRSPPLYWTGLLALPAIQCLAAISLFDGAPERDAPVPSSRLMRYFELALFFVGMFAAVFLVLGAGYLLWILFRGLVLDGRMLPISRVSTLIASLAGQPAQLYAWAVFISAAGMTALVVIGDLFAWAFRRMSGSAESNRSLSEAEGAFVATSADRVRAFAKERGFVDAKLSGWISVAIVLLLLSVPYAVFMLAPQQYGEEELAKLGWHLYVTEIGVSIVLAIGAGIAVLMLPGTVLASLSETYAEAAGWATLMKEPDEAPEAALRSAVAARRLSSSDPFDPGAFLRSLNLPMSVSSYLLAGIMVVTLPFFLIHDQSRYFLLTDDYVEVMEYWTLEKHRYSYDQVQRVDLYCRDGDAEYELVLPDEFSADLLDRSTLRERFDDVVRVESKVGNSVARNLPPTSSRGYASCVEELVRDWNEEDASAAKEIFRLEDWQRQRWNERIGRAQ